MTDETGAPSPEEFPPELQEALRRMSQRGRVVDLNSGEVVAEGGQLVTDPSKRVACHECARAVALGWWGSISRHIGPADAPVCLLCGEGEAVLTAEEWFAETADLIVERTRDGQRRTWRDDALKGLGL